jgi:nucleoside-diphosphate-sugar epimerase
LIFAREDNKLKDKVLVIGGAGYLGSVLVKKLVENDYPVKILDSFIYGKRSVEQFRNNPLIEISEGDIRNTETVNSCLKDVRSVILLAAVVGDPASLSRPEQTIETNLLASHAIASACKLLGINKFIYASTCSVYGIGGGILDENAPLNPVSLYAKTKITSESKILQLAGDGFSPVIMRMATLYGYSPRMRFDLVVNTMTMTAFLEKKINVFGGGQWRPLLHVEDAADAYLKVLGTDNSVLCGKIYNVGSEEQNYCIRDVAEIISLSLGNISVNTETDVDDSRDYRVSFRRIRDELAFKVKHSIEEASSEIFIKLVSGEIKDPKQKFYYNHYFDSSEELIG